MLLGLSQLNATLGLWTERAPTQATPADPASRDRDLPFKTELSIAIVSLKDILSVYDISWIALQRAE